MEILKQIFDKRDNWIFRHIALYSIIGIMVIAINNAISYHIGGFYAGYFGFSSSNTFEIALNVTIAIYIPLYLFGYMCDTVNPDTKGFPELHLKSLITFFKVSPLIIYWIIFTLALYYLIGIVFSSHTGYKYILNTFLIVSIPWINLIPIFFGKNYEHRKEYYSVLYYLKVIIKNLYLIARYAVQTIAISIIPIIFTILIFYYSNKVLYSNLSLALRIFGLTYFGYSIIILYLAYIKALSEKFKF